MAKDTNFYSLRIAERVRETDDAVTLYFEIPEALRHSFAFDPGQHLNLRFVLEGTEYRRAYSLCTSAREEKWGVTIKHVEDGIVSAHILNACAEGDVVDVMPPEGRFILKPDPERRRVYYFFAAGSGITPLMSQMRSLLEDEPLCTIHLYYGNRDQDSIIFKSWLDHAAIQYAEQFTVDYILSKPQKPGVLSGVFSKKKVSLWLGETGRINEVKVRDFLERYSRHGVQAAYYICGPGTMIDTVREALFAWGVNKENIHTEFFTTSSKKTTPSASPTSETYRLVAHLRGERIETTIRDRTILHTLEDAGYDPPYSCTSGTCATCMAKIISGKVRMDQCYALSDEEVEQGYVLTCQSHPVDGDVEVTYDY